MTPERKKRFTTDARAWHFTLEHAQSVANQYHDRFGNLDEVSHPAIFTKMVFIQLLSRALETGQALTRKDVEAVFPEVKGWEEIQP